MTASRTLARTGTEMAGPRNRLTILECDGTRVTHECDALYRLVTDQRDGTYTFNRTYTYDEVGNRLTKSDAGALCTYGYDQADQLLRVGPWGSYVYPTNWSSDENGNLTVENYVGNKTTFIFLRHEVAWKIVTRDRPDVTGCPITRTLRGLAARQLAVWSPPTTYPTGGSRAPEPRGDGASASIRR